MKKVLVLALVAIAGFGAWKVGLLEAAPAKAYKMHRQRYLEARGFSQELVAQAKWSIEIERCEQSGSRAEVLATGENSQDPGKRSFVCLRHDRHEAAPGSTCARERKVGRRE